MKVKPIFVKLAISLGAALLALIICFLIKPTWEATSAYYFPLKTPSAGGLSALKIGVSQGDPGSVGLLGNTLETPLPGSAPSTATALCWGRYSSMAP